MIKYSPKDLTDWDIDGVDSRDYPDFCDAFLVEAWVGDYELTEEELEYVQETFPEWISEQAFESFL